MKDKLRKYRPHIIFGAILLLLIYFSLNVFSYFSPIPWCKIRIHGNLSGNRATIKEAIKLLRKQDKPAYRTLCKNINFIYEKYCIDRDWHIAPTNYVRRDASGCYIRGSKSAYISPSKDSSLSSIKLRAETLKKLSEYSKTHWLTKK